MKKNLIRFIIGYLLLTIHSAFASTMQERQIFMLESALAPNSPAAAATLWATAIKNRNGALQYMLLCPTLQQKNLKNLQQLNWVTGVSSPQIKSFAVKQLNSQIFAIAYQINLNQKNIGSIQDTIHLRQTTVDDHSSQMWCINKFNLLTPTLVSPKK